MKEQKSNNGRRQYWKDRATKERVFEEFWMKLKRRKKWKVLDIFISETFATFIFTVIAVSAVAIGVIPLWVIGLIEAAAKFVILVTFSGDFAGHLSPFDTLALYIGGKIPYPWYTCFLYLIATTCGWILGSATVIGLTIGENKSLGLGTPELDSNYTEAQGFFAECLGTCIAFGVSILVLYSYERRTLYSEITTEGGARSFYYPFVSASAHFVGFMTSCYISGASLNPHRFFWPAVISGKFYAPTQWFYFVGPVVGAILIGIFYGLYLWIDNNAYLTKNPLKKKLANALSSNNVTSGNQYEVLNEKNV